MGADKAGFTGPGDVGPGDSATDSWGRGLAEHPQAFSPSSNPLPSAFSDRTGLFMGCLMDVGREVLSTAHHHSLHTGPITLLSMMSSLAEKVKVCMTLEPALRNSMWS